MSDSSVLTIQRAEARVRRRAARLGYRLVKSPSRNPEHWEFGTYGLVEYQSNAVAMAVAGSSYGHDLGEVDAHLSRLSE